MRKIDVLTKFGGVGCSLIALAGCEPGPAQVTQFNGDSVTITRIELGLTINEQNPEVAAEAERICASAGKRSVYGSVDVNYDTYEVSYLYLCLPQ